MMTSMFAAHSEVNASVTETKCMLLSHTLSDSTRHQGVQQRFMGVKIFCHSLAYTAELAVL